MSLVSVVCNCALNHNKRTVTAHHVITYRCVLQPKDSITVWRMYILYVDTLLYVDTAYVDTAYVDTAHVDTA